MRREFSRKNKNWTFDGILKILIFLSLSIVFAKSFIWGNKGFLHYLSLQKEINVENQKINQLVKDIDSLKSNIDLWQNNDFMIEKMAREDLQMALPDEKVYILR